jgi:hypothetical protein
MVVHGLCYKVNSFNGAVSERQAQAAAMFFCGRFDVFLK